MSNLEIFCVTDVPSKNLESLNLKLAGVGQKKFSTKYIKCNEKKNIHEKEKYYSELTFHYWFWKNMLNYYDDNKWIGFCQKRRFWIKDEFSEINNIDNLKNSLLTEIPSEWEGNDAFLCKPILVSPVKKMKLLKRGWRNVIKQPSILIDKKKHNIKLQFDMFHGYGILNKAIELLPVKEQEDFQYYINNEIKFNPNIMFISKKKILKLWFENLFKWLFDCEKIFGFKKLKGYDTGRLYAYLSERYLSFWFTSRYKTKDIPWKFFETIKRN